MTGKHLKGKTYEQIMGIALAIKIKEKRKLARLGCHLSEKTKKKISESEKGKAVSEETRKKLSINHKGGGQTFRYTSIEIKIQNFLKQLGIEFFTHQHMKISHGYECDILIPSANLIIECDGNYWHKYPLRNDLDHIRTKELIEKGFKVLRLWEIEINQMTIDAFKNTLNKCTGGG